MRTAVVQYKAIESRREENRTLIEGVFETLARSGNTDIGYLVFELSDGSFLHIAQMPEGPNPLTALPAFKRFVSDIEARQQSPAVQLGAKVVGNYRMLSEGAA
jgi:hypothetical protein